MINSNKNQRLSILKWFWIRRAFRLLPSSWLFIIITFILSVYYNSTGIFGSPKANFTDIFAQLFQVSNFRYYYCTLGYFECGKNQVYWSLSLEEQFYLLMPIILLLLNKKTIYLLIGLVIIQFPLVRPIFSFGWMIRTDAIAWGCLIAIFTQSSVYEKIKPCILNNIILKFLTAVALIASIAIFARGIVTNYIIGLMALSSAIMVYISSYDTGLLFGKLRNNKTLLWIGSRSYGIYLCHVPCFYFVMETVQRVTLTPLDGSDTLPILFFGLISTCLIAELSFRTIETPCRRFGRNLHKNYVNKYA